MALKRRKKSKNYRQWVSIIFNNYCDATSFNLGAQLQIFKTNDGKITTELGQWKGGEKPKNAGRPGIPARVSLY